VKFFVPLGTTMSDDTAFCLKARERGHRFIADYGLITEHWGYNVKWQKFMGLTITLDETMTNRRAKMRRDGVYVHPPHDANMAEAVKQYIDLDKIEKLK